MRDSVSEVVYEVVYQGHELVLWYIVDEFLKVYINNVCISVIEALK